MLLCPQETRVLPHILQAAFLVPKQDSLRILRAISKSSVQYLGLNEKSGTVWAIFGKISVFLKCVFLALLGHF